MCLFIDVYVYFKVISIPQGLVVSFIKLVLYHSNFLQVNFVCAAVFRRFTCVLQHVGLFTVTAVQCSTVEHTTVHLLFSGRMFASPWFLSHKAVLRKLFVWLLDTCPKTRPRGDMLRGDMARLVVYVQPYRVTNQMAIQRHCAHKLSVLANI